MLSLLFDGDYAIGTHSCAECAADAFFAILHIRGGIALRVKLILCNSKALFRTCVNAKSTALTHIRIKGYFCHMYSPFTKTCASLGKVALALSRQVKKFSFATSST